MWRWALALLIVAFGVFALAGGNPLRQINERLPVGVGMPASKIPCLPWNWFWLHNTPPERIERGQMVQFRAYGLEPIAPDGLRLVKIVGAVAGDTWQTTEDGLFINGRWYDDIRVSGTIETEEVQVVPEGMFLAMGVTDDSFDSRYFGLVSEAAVVGTAVPLVARDWDTDYHSEHEAAIVHRFAVLLGDFADPARPGQGRRTGGIKPERGRRQGG